jgi:recombination protein RecT
LNLKLDFDSIESKKIYNETSDFEFQDESKHEVSNFDKDDSNIIEADAEVQDDVHKNPEEGE